MILKKLGLSAVVVCLSLLLSSCVEVKGDVSINSAARLNGEITYTIDKSLASAVGISSLSDINRQATEQSAEETEFCKDVPFTEDASSYLFKCPLKDVISESGDLTAVIVGGDVVFRYKGNLESTSTDTNRTDFGSVSLVVRFIDPVISYKENKVGLVQKIDSFTYRISGYSTEPMDIEIVANCSSRCGVVNSAPIPVPTQTVNPSDAASAAVEAASKATAEAQAAQILANAKAEAATILAEAKVKASASSKSKKITITCIKGKTSKKVTGVKPKCPPGYKKR
jgi:hypothetical protein